MPLRIIHRHQRSWLFLPERLVDLHPGIFTPVREKFRRGTGPVCLVPEIQNLRRAVRLLKRRMGIVNSGIHDADDDACPGQLEHRLILHLKDPGAFQRYGT